MGVPVSKKSVTAEEYLEAEHLSLERHEYDFGEVLEMAGSTFEHDRISGNLYRRVSERLDGTPCVAMTSNMRIALNPGGRYVYPDLSVFCGEPQFDSTDKNRTTILNPRLVAEVLSLSTELYDRTTKFYDYTKLNSLREYVLVSQFTPRVETLGRGEDGRWVLDHWEGLEAVARLRSINIDLPLSEIYSGVRFDVPEEAGSTNGHELDTNEEA